MEHRTQPADEKKIIERTDGFTLKDLSKNLVDALNPDLAADAREQAIASATRPFHDPKLRDLLDQVRQKNELTIDIISQDEVLEASFSEDAKDRAKGLVESFEQFLKDNKDEITALQILYNRPYAERLNF